MQLSVSNVVKGLPADRAGLRAGDRILEVNHLSNYLIADHLLVWIECECILAYR